MFMQKAKEYNRTSKSPKLQRTVKLVFIHKMLFLSEHFIYEFEQDNNKTEHPQ